MAEVEAPRIPDAEVVIDGRLDEAAWARAAVVTDFVRWIPSKGGPFAGRTEARVFYDDRRLYVGFTCEDPEPGKIRAHVAPREDVNADDQVAVLLDPFLDRKSAYSLWINALGVQQDFRDSVTGDFNLAWDTVWSSKGVLTATGYTVEIAIPWKSLPYPRDEVQRWGLILARSVARDGTYYAWPALDLEEANVIAQEAELTGLRPPVDRLRLEALPTVTAHQSWARLGEGFEAEDPWDGAVQPGLDLRYGPTPDLSIEATLNPDFSQIEADPFLMDMNIRHALYLEERRPFFLSGYEAFTDPLETLYTRAVVNPLWGGKVAGHLGSTQLGVLTAYDVSPEGSVVEGGTLGFDGDDVDDGDLNAQTTMLRVKQDFGKDLQIGALYAEKQLVGGPGDLYASPYADNEVGGADLTATLGERWLVQAEALGSRTRASLEATAHALGPAIAVVDLAAPEPSFGHRVSVELERRGHPGWNGTFRVRDTSTDFRSETAYLTRTGFTTLYTSQSYEFQPTDLSSVTPSAEASLAFGRDSDLPPEHWVGFNLEGGPTQTSGCEVGGGHGSEQYAEASFNRWYGWFGCGVEPAGWLDLEAGIDGGGTVDYGTAEAARVLQGTVEATLRPLPRLQLEGSYAHQSVWGREEGDLRYRLNLVRGKANLQFTRPLGLRLIAQWRDDEAVLDESALLTWLFSPGTAIYLGYSETREGDLDLGVAERSVFAKLSGLLRL